MSNKEQIPNVGNLNLSLEFVLDRNKGRLKKSYLGLSNALEHIKGCPNTTFTGYLTIQM